jgi:hypothetical protein
MAISIKATKFSVFALILFFAVSVQSQTSDSIYVVPKGTKIYLRMDNEINSKVSSVNDTFTAVISQPVMIRAVEVLPIGTVIEGRILFVKSASIGNRDGSFTVKFETLYLPAKGGKRQIEATLISEDNRRQKTRRLNNATTIAGATGVGVLIGSLIQKAKGGLIGAGAGLVTGTSIVLLQKGEETSIKAGQEFRIELEKDLILPPQDY